jgi:hypothetical protein
VSGPAKYDYLITAVCDQSLIIPWNIIFPDYYHFWRL